MCLSLSCFLFACFVCVCVCACAESALTVLRNFFCQPAKDTSPPLVAAKPFWTVCVCVCVLWRLDFYFAIQLLRVLGVWEILIKCEMNKKCMAWNAVFCSQTKSADCGHFQILHSLMNTHTHSAHNEWNGWAVSCFKTFFSYFQNKFRNSSIIFI